MCFFITIALPTTSVEPVRAAYCGPGLVIERTMNPTAVEAAGIGRVPLLVTGGGCSCAWYARPARCDVDERISRAVARYRREGWSEAKIERAMESMRSAARHSDASKGGLDVVIIDVLDSLVRSYGATAIWVHDFTGQVESELYRIRRRERWSLDKLRHRGRSLDLDVLVEIHCTLPPEPLDAR